MKMVYIYATKNDSSLPIDGILTNLTLVVPNDMNMTPMSPSDSCHGNWAEPNHVLYQVAHVFMLVGFLCPASPRGLIALHGGAGTAFLLLSAWSWIMVCAPDLFSWNFSLTLINAFQVCYVFYNLKPISLPSDLQLVYTTLFEPLKVTKTQFKNFVTPIRCNIHTLNEGEAYATEEVTKTDRLSLLLSGTVNVVSNGQFLHQIQPRQFLDSPEFESSTHGEDRFHVSIVAATPCRYATWTRHSLQILFTKEPYVAIVLGHILGRDITNKLYLLNERLKTQKGSRVDIRLPNVSSAALSGIDLRPEIHNEALGHVRCEMDELDDEDLLDELSEKMPMFPNGVTAAGHTKLHHFSSSTFSSGSSR